MRKCRNLAAIALAVLAGQSAKATTTIISDNFEGDTQNQSPPSNTGIIGSWLPGTGLLVSNDYSQSTGSLSGEYADIQSLGINYTSGYLQAASPVTSVGQTVHAEIDFHYTNGFAAFGISSDMSNLTPAGQTSSALMYLSFQDVTGNYSLNLQAMNSSGNLVDVGSGFQLHCPDNPFPNGQNFDQIDFDYTVGASTANLTVNGDNIGSVPLRNPGAPAAGMFFVENTPSSRQPYTVYYLDNLLMTTQPVISGWANSSSGNWQTASNWSTGIVPAGIDGDAEFLNGITANSNVYTDTPITEGILHFNNPHTYVLDGAGSLTLQTSSGNAQVNVDQGTQEINLPTTLASNTVFTVQPGATLVISDPLTINSGKSLTTTGGGTVTYNSIINVGSSASITFANPTHAYELAMASGSTASVAGTGTVLELDNLSNGGTLDVQKNTLLINYGNGPDPIASIKTQILSGYNNGSWTGTGITSTSVQSSPGIYGIGYADAADPGNPAGLASGQIEVTYTLLGDANLDHKVNGTDFAILATNFNQAVGGWDQGDFNYDGKANGSDFALLAANFNQGIGGAVAGDMAALEAFAAANGLLADVPEPTSMAVIILGTIGTLMGRRRGRTRCDA